MANFDFKRTNRKCSVSGRTFESGEEYISFLIENEGELIRQDIETSQWTEPPDGCVGWWKSKVPDLEQGIVYWAPKDILMSYFQHLVDQKKDPHKTYVMAILLIQKKHIRLLDTENHDEIEVMLLQDSSTKEKFDVQVVDVDAETASVIEAELADKLFTDVAPTSESSS